MEAQATPKISVSYLRLVIAASLIEKILSLNQVMQIGASLSLKKASPNYLAKIGNYSTTESLILQFLSWLSSVSAGIIDWDKFSIPSTLFKSSSLLNKFNLTSEDSSLNKAKNIGRMCSLVLALSMTAHSASKFSASALLTY